MQTFMFFMFLPSKIGSFIVGNYMMLTGVESFGFCLLNTYSSMLNWNTFVTVICSFSILSPFSIVFCIQILWDVMLYFY